MQRVFVRPAINKNVEQEAGQEPSRLMVAKPSGGYLAATGELVDRDSYWLRRLADADVEETAPTETESDAGTTGTAARAKRT